MKKADRRPREDSLQRYDWSRATRGKYRAKAARASTLLRILDPELASRFPDSRSVNAALRALSALEKALPAPRARRTRAA
jgi:hypothetical protein